MKKYYIKTFGCAMNHSDSERFANVVEKIGYSPTEDFETADLIVFNSCSVRQKAEDRISGLRPQIERLKSQNPELKIILSGCMARRTWRGVTKTGSPLQMTHDDRESELKKQMPWIDFVLETKEFGKLPQKLGMQMKIEDEPSTYLSYTPKYKSNFQAFVPISTGCDHFCTFCIVPFARGGEVNRPADEIVHEIENLVYCGYKDVTLLGQTVNRWINPKNEEELKQGMIANTQIPELNTKPIKNLTDEPRDFLQLLEVLDGTEGDWWMTFVSSHPNYMTDELIEFIGKSVKENKHMRPYLHFALQSGNDEILKRMNRRYTSDQFKTRVEKMKKEIPGLSISTDIIVGFPGESEEQFQDTVKIMEDLEFDMAYINEYSPRKGTASGLLKDDVPHAEKTRRKNYLNDEVLAKSAHKKNAAMVGTIQKVLITKIDKEQIKGQTKNMKDVKITLDKSKEINVGDFAEVEITNSSNWALEGKLN